MIFLIKKSILKYTKSILFKNHNKLIYYKPNRYKPLFFKSWFPLASLNTARLSAPFLEPGLRPAGKKIRNK